MPSPGRGMGSGGRKVIWALSFLLLVREASSAKNIWRRALHARLAEKPRVSARGGEAGRGRAAPRLGRAGTHVCQGREVGR